MNRIPFAEEGDGPELVPPAELVRLRNLLMRGPRAAVRARHLAVATAEARERPLVAGTAGRLATWSGRVAVGLVASLAITSGLAGAQLLPQPAQRLLSGVSSRFAPAEPAPSTTLADPTDPVAAASGGASASADRRARSRIDDGNADATGDAATTSPPTTDESLVLTTIPGPTGPGSPADPTLDPDDPGSSTTTTTEPEPTTTTTTTPPSTTTTTTTPPSTTTTTTPSSR